MRNTPKSVVHINFLSGVLIFQPERIWTALRSAEESGKVSVADAEHLRQDLGDAAIHLATREYLLRAAVRRLRECLTILGRLVPDPATVEERFGYRVVGNDEIYTARDNVLLALDAVLFEFRSYLDLLANFTYRLMIGAHLAVPSSHILPSGEKLVTVKRDGNLSRHSFLRYLCDKLGCPEEWYRFLNDHRNLFTHEAAPYIAIEDRLMLPSELDFLVMRTNIHDFSTASSEDYFRVSEVKEIVEGIVQLAGAVQVMLVTELET